MKLKISFKLNKKLDKEMAWAFFGQKAAGVDFSSGITSVHPKLKTLLGKDKKEQKKIINEYFDEFYKKNEKELKECLLKMKQDWKEDEEGFCQTLDMIFKKPKVPKGKYIGYLSIINCNPRFLNDKTFQIFYKHKAGTNFIVAHEVLHFFFYGYSLKKYPEIFKKLDQDSGIYWILAELFNDVIMSRPELFSKKYTKNAYPYPAHAKYFNTVNSFWNKNSNVDNWIKDSHKYLKQKMWL
jgi:hypothetical protein